MGTFRVYSVLTAFLAMAPAWADEPTLVFFKTRVSGLNISGRYLCPVIGKAADAPGKLLDDDRSPNPRIAYAQTALGLSACRRGKPVSAEVTQAPAAAVSVAAPAMVVPLVEPVRAKKAVRHSPHYAVDPALVSSNASDDLGTGPVSAEATIRERHADGSETAHFTRYICRGGPNSAGEIVEPSYNVTVAKLQIQRSREVCASICGYLGKKLGHELITEDLASPAVTCSTLPKPSGTLTLVGSSSIQACASGHKLALFQRGFAAAERRALSAYSRSHSCDRPRAAETIAKGVLNPASGALAINDQPPLRAHGGR